MIYEKALHFPQPLYLAVGKHEKQFFFAFGFSTTHGLNDFVAPADLLDDLDTDRTTSISVSSDKHAAKIACSTQKPILKIFIS